MYKFRESGTFAVNVEDIPPSSSSPASAHASGGGVRSSACDRTTQGEGGWRDMADNITTDGNRSMECEFGWASVCRWSREAEQENRDMHSTM